MKALIITRSPSVSSPATTPFVARHSISTSAVAITSCCPALSRDSVRWLTSRALRSFCKASS